MKIDGRVVGGVRAFLGRFAGRFPRVESRRWMRWYVRGLLSEVERKNSWTLAEAAGDSGPEGMQRLLNFYAWTPTASLVRRSSPARYTTKVGSRYPVHIRRAGAGLERTRVLNRH